MGIHITPIFNINFSHLEVGNLEVTEDASITGDLDGNTCTFNSATLTNAEVGDLTVTGAINGIEKTVTITHDNGNWYYCGLIGHNSIKYNSVTSYEYYRTVVFEYNPLRKLTGTYTLGYNGDSLNTFYVLYTHKDGTTTSESLGYLITNWPTVISIPDDTYGISLYITGGSGNNEGNVFVKYSIVSVS